MITKSVQEKRRQSAGGCLDGRIKSIGYNIVTDRGDYVPIKNKKV